MGLTVIGGSAADFPFVYVAPLIELKAIWADDWEIEPELELVSCGMQASSMLTSTCEVRRRYGQDVKMPYEGNYQARDSWDLSNYWLRISLIKEQGTVPIFVGRIENQARNIKGSDANPCGLQSWVVHGGLQLLRKLDISQSVHLNSDATTSLVGWIPEMNLRDRRGLIVGNRSATKDGDVYLYGGQDTWTHREYVEYLIAKFIQQPGEPTWSLGGQADILEGMKLSINFAESMSAADMLRKLIPVECGIDFQVRNTDDGFEINVFALIAEESSVAGVTMPKNPNTLEIRKTDEKDLIENQVVESNDRRVDRIVMKGKRIVVCGTLWGARSKPSGDVVTLVKKWLDTIESEYIDAGGVGSDATDNDHMRRRDKYRSVYQAFGAPVDWDLGNKQWSPKCELDGTLTPAGGEFQKTVRNTLPWIPLKEAFDYTVDPPVDNNLPGHEPDVKPPLAWIFDELPDDGNQRYIQCDLNGMSVHRPHLDWGIFINASPNHLLALNHWTDDEIGSTDTEPRYDHETLVATIAIEADQRLQLGYQLPDALAAGDGSCKTIIDEHAELWILLPDTVVDVDAEGQLVTSGSELRILRNDVVRLALTLAGAVGRYINERIRMRLRFKGHLAWGDLVGNIVTFFSQGDDKLRVGAPLTGVEWVCKPTPETIVTIGYA